MSIDIHVLDQRTVTIPNKTTETRELEKLADAINAAADDGYRLVGVVPIQREVGTQRDPETVTDAVKLVFRRPS
jgi:hypothetical protein